MFEDILQKKNMNISQLSKVSGVGYNYVFKIVRNQTDFNRCGIETAKKIADVLGLSLNDIYDYKDKYFQSKIYYQDQKDWNTEKYGELNAEINKLFLIGIDYHFMPKDCQSRSENINKVFDTEISCIRYDKLSEETKCIMVAVLNQQEILDKFVKIYKNLNKLTSQKPLKKKLYIASEPYNIFSSYTDMNIAY